MVSLVEITIFLAAAVVAALIAKRFGIGSVLGYLSIGVLLGPWGFSLINGVEEILHFGEMGVVFLLFIIGLELKPTRLWSMRKAIFGLGASQIFITTLIIAACSYWLGQSLQAAIVIGAGLSLSSTALAIQTLSEKRQLTTKHGRGAFSLLLFQDLTAIPLIAIVPLLVVTSDNSISWLDFSISAGKAIAVIIAVVLGGHFLLRHVFRIVASTKIREAFTAVALLTVLGTALIVDQVGLSMALGAFLAGVLLADSEYRHELEAGIEPFKGLLLGLFFIAVGMSVNLGITVEKPLTILSIVSLLVLLKFTVIYFIGRVSKMNNMSAQIFAILTSQGGEFAFVIFTAAKISGLLSHSIVDDLILIVTLSMVTTPFLLLLSTTISKRQKKKETKSYELPLNRDPRVIIAGFGRVGQIIGRLLHINQIRFTALETSTHQVSFIQKFGDRVYYGDATQLNLLRAAGAENAEIFVIAIDNVKQSLLIAKLVSQYFPHMKIFARARDREHAYALMDLGITRIQRETILSSIELGKQVLVDMGLSKIDAQDIAEKFQKMDEKRLIRHNEEDSDQGWSELEELFSRDRKELDQ